LFEQNSSHNIGLIFTNGYIFENGKKKSILSTKGVSKIVYGVQERKRNIFPAKVLILLLLVGWYLKVQ
jgi:hypothetical protein